jgi:uncharacterized membrane-anchored protein YhcB (DUF1043 family)
MYSTKKMLAYYVGGWVIGTAIGYIAMALHNRKVMRDEAMLASIRDQNLATFTGEGKIDLTKPIWSQMC